MSDELRRLPPDLEALLHAERAADGPNELARGRVRQRLEQTLGVAMGAAASTAAPAATGKLTALGGKSLVTAKLALVLAAGGSILAAGYFAHRAARSNAAVISERAHRLSPQAVAVAPAASGPSGSASASANDALAAAEAAAQEAAAAAAERDAAARPVTARVAATTAKLAHADRARTLPKPAAAAAHPRTLADERALLEKARTALAGGDDDGALAAVNRHAKQFPSGLLAEERDALRVRALASRGDDVHALFDDFQSRYPLSLFLPSVRAAVESAHP